MVTTKEEATKIILNFLNSDQLLASADDEYTVVSEHTILTKFGWVFHVVSKRFLETKNTDHILYGQLPLIVEKIDGAVHSCGDPGESIQTAIREYEVKKNPTLLNKTRLFINVVIDIITGRQSGFPDF